MVPAGKEIFGAVIAVTLIIILLSSLIIIVIINYKRKQEKHLLEKNNLMLSFENERIRIQTEVEEETRQNLASELHDNIGQLMSLTNVILASINPVDQARCTEKIHSAQELVLRSIKEMRQLTRLVQGENILSGGLQEAMEQEIRWLGRNEYYTLSYSFPPELENYRQEDKDLIIFRLFQESLHNIIKHADATKIAIGVRLTEGCFRLQIEDNGKGFDPAAITAKGMGIRNMQKRVQMLQGRMTMESLPDAGTVINFILPYAGQSNIND